MLNKGKLGFADYVVKISCCNLQVDFVIFSE